MSGRIIAGVDPGLTGSISFFDAANPSEIIALDIPVVGKKINIPALAQLLRSMQPIAAVVEAASSRPGQGVSSVFRYGQCYGALLATLSVIGIPTHLVGAARWKKAFAIGADKERSRLLAVRRWPSSSAFSRKKDHHRSEAALLAVYGVEHLQLGRPEAGTPPASDHAGVSL